MLAAYQIIKKIVDNKNEIKKFGVKKIGLFGSYLRNEQKESSDIDFLVEFKKGKKTFDNYMGLKLFLENLFNCKIDLVMKESIKEEIKPYILRSVKYAEAI